MAACESVDSVDSGDELTLVNCFKPLLTERKYNISWEADANEFRCFFCTYKERGGMQLEGSRRGFNSETAVSSRLTYFLTTLGDARLPP